MKKTFLFGIVLFLITVSSAFAADDLTISGTPGLLTANPGDTVNTSFLLTNSGTTDLNLTFAPLTLTQGIESFTGTLTPVTTENFIAGSTQLVNISMLLGADQFAGTYAGTVEVSGGNASDSFTLQVSVNAEPSATMNDLSMTIIQGNAGTGLLTVTNTGNTVYGANLVSGNLVGLNPANVISSAAVIFDDAVFDVAYGSSHSTGMTVTIPSGAAADTYTATLSCSACASTLTSTLTVTVQEPVATLSLSKSTLEFKEKPGQTFSGTITVTNDGSVNLVDITPVFSGLSAYNITTDAGTFSLNIGQTKLVTIKGSIPVDADIEQSPFTGDLTFSNSLASASTGIKLYAENQLELKKFDIYVNNKHERVSDGETIDNIKPGDTIRFKGEVENTWSTSRTEDKDINDIEADLFVENIDDSDDIDETLDINDLNARDTDTFEYTFVVPLNTDEDTFDGYVILRGEDDDNARHYYRLDFSLKVERDRNDIKLSDIVVQPQTLSCDRSFSVDARIINIGRDTQRNVVLEVKSSQLNIQQQETGIRLSDNPDDSDNEFEKNFLLSIPDTQRAGTYRLNINAYLDRTSLADFKTADIIVKDCATQEPTGTTGNEGTGQTNENAGSGNGNVKVITSPTTTTTEIPDVSVIAQPVQKETSFTDTSAYIVLLGFIALLLLVGVISLLVLLFKK
ncbi:MAG: hypothetical protein GXP63_00140 [DPANN group archaeon]|nr:hypothetical protein [DPANN group archaeon]